MATVVNDRDVLLQAASMRLLPVDLPENVQVNFDSVFGAGALASLDFVDANTQVTNLGDLAFADTILANQIGAGTLPVGVIYAGDINADNITSGTLTGRTIQTAASGSNRVVIDHSMNSVLIWVDGLVRIRLGDAAVNGYISSEGSSTAGFYGSAGSAAAFFGRTQSSGPAVRAEAITPATGVAVNAMNSATGVAINATASNSSSSTNHGLRAAKTAGTATSGIVGSAIGYDFYAEGQGNYGPFTGVHDALIVNGHAATLGDILIDGDIVQTKGVSDAIAECSLCNSVGQAGAIGVLAQEIGALSGAQPAAMIESIAYDSDGHRVVTMAASWHAYKDTHQLIGVNAVGEGLINVCGRGGNISKGDLIICSDMLGKGQRQGDNVVRGNTVAKSRVSITFDDPDDVHLIPCIYLCG